MEDILLFNIHSDFFGMSLFNIVEVIQIVEITEVPLSPKFIEGMINLRGEVIYIIDLRKLLGYEPLSYSIFQKIIIANMQQKKIGLIVDSVDNVVKVPLKDITFPSSSTPLSEFLRGVVNYKEKLIFILDLNKVLNYEEKAIMEKLNERQV